MRIPYFLVNVIGRCQWVENPSYFRFYCIFINKFFFSKIIEGDLLPTGTSVPGPWTPSHSLSPLSMVYYGFQILEVFSLSHFLHRSKVPFDDDCHSRAQRLRQKRRQRSRCRSSFAGNETTRRRDERQAAGTIR